MKVRDAHGCWAEWVFIVLCAALAALFILGGLAAESLLSDNSPGDNLSRKVN